MAPSSPPSPSPPPHPQPSSDYIASGLISAFIGVVVLVCLLCLLCFRRSKAVEERIEARNVKLSRARGVTRPASTKSNLSNSSSSTLVSRTPNTPLIVLPEKCKPRDSYSHDYKAVVSPPLARSHATPALSIQVPSSNASHRSRAWSILSPVFSYHSRSSSGFSVCIPSPSPHRLDVSRSSLTPISPVSPMFSSWPRSVHQLFEPVLPDELHVFRYSECLVVLRSFGDGWCLVIRDTPQRSRISWLSARKGDHMEIGLVPEWVFVEPHEGKVPTRPFRGESINALHLGQSPTSARYTTVPWSVY